MKIQLTSLGKRFRWEWIFRDMEFALESGEGLAVYGPNGSGKSTLLKVVSGYLTPSEGKIAYERDGKSIPRNEVFQYLTFAAPYTELIEEFTLKEMVAFHFTFKHAVDQLSMLEIMDNIGLSKAGDKQIRHFSSGMKQRVKLALAIMTNSTLLLLDEPGTNLDHASHEWYLSLLNRYRGERTLIVASNEERDFQWCERQLNISDYKGAMR